MAGFNHFPQIAARLKPACRQIVTNATLYTRDAVQGGAAVRTGFMKGAVYAVTPDGNSTYGQVSPTEKDSYLLPEVRPDNDMTGIVGCAANYSIYVNYGTRFQAAQPFFEPGVEAGRNAFDTVDLEMLLRV
jgi:HK97 gp10 family phage protein